MICCSSDNCNSSPGGSRKGGAELITATDQLIIILLGPTAVGKTSFSLDLAELLHAEIICADSMLVYRGMDIGTAKPTLEERRRVRHHLMDVVSPKEVFSVKKFLDLAVPILEELLARGRRPLFVGGTGLYIRALTEGLVDAPACNPALLRELETEAERFGIERLHARLAQVDPRSAAEISSGDCRRLVRALAVYIQEGVALSELHAEKTVRPPYKFIKIGLTRDRCELYERIDRRVDDMIKKGLLEETERLLDDEPSHSALQALGYKEIAGYIQGHLSLEDAVGMIKQRTRRFCKRQQTWFRKDPEIQWLDITGLEQPSEIMAMATRSLKCLEVMRYCNDLI